MGEALEDYLRWEACHYGGGKRAPIIPADSTTRLLRMRAYKSFDRIWQQGYMSREVAYGWLAGRLNVQEPEAHMGQMLDHDLLHYVVEVCDEYIGTTEAQDDFLDDL